MVTSEARDSAHCVFPRHVSFDKHTFKLISVEVESAVCLRRNDAELLKQVATIVVGGEEGEE